MKKYHVLIKDASRGRFRVCQMGPNGEMINQSEVLDSVDNVIKNILAAERVINPLAPIARKHTSARQRFNRVVNLVRLNAINVKYVGKYGYMFGPVFAEKSGLKYDETQAC